MLEHSCKRAGADGCGFTTRANSEDELLAKVSAHARDVHGVKNVTNTIANYLRDAARG